jgi:outer membrane protein OmpA-like peptidoglycan-associated protein
MQSCSLGSRWDYARGGLAVSRNAARIGHFSSARNPLSVSARHSRLASMAPRDIRHIEERAMKKYLAVLVAAAGIASGPAWTAETGKSPKEEKIGLGSGAAIGAAAGGPVGLILGASLGGWIGNRLHEEKSAHAEAEAELATVSGLLRTRERTLEDLRAEIGMQRREFRNALRDALSVELYFGTAESRLDSASEKRLARLTELLAKLDDIAIIVEGHADARGQVEFNEQLSAARAASVRDALVRGGVPTDRITAEAQGESMAVAAVDDAAALALDRRVALTIIDERDGNRIARRQ